MRIELIFTLMYGRIKLDFTKISLRFCEEISF